LGPYIKSPKPFKCPADTAQVLEGGKLMGLVRSVSMNNWLGGDPILNSAGTRTWTSPSKYGTYYQRTSDVKEPALMIVILDERWDSINDGCWMTDPDTLYQIVDLPADYHDGAGSFSFVDGHSDLHPWTDPRTMPPFTPGEQLTLDLKMPGDVDVLWMAAHALGLPSYPAGTP
jgi:prepilin-type processing-associated H-X9-DG protein